MPTPQMRQLLSAVDTWIPPKRRRNGSEKQFFTYSAEFTPLVLNTTQVQSIQIQADSDFLILQCVRTVTDTTNALFLAACAATILLTDTGAGRQLMDRPVSVDNIAGTAQLPAVWSQPYYIAAASTFNVQLLSLDLVNSRNIRVSFLGLKIF